MSLSTRPFARLSALDEIARQDHRNVGGVERTFSLVAGGLLVAAGILLQSRSRILLGLLGGALLHRGASGRCEAYRLLKIDTAQPHARRGVADGKGIKIEAVTHVEKPSEEVFRCWRRLENLPRFMPHVLAVDESAEGISHWTVRGPFNRELQWDAEIIGEEPGKMLAWQTLPGAPVASAGSVWFEPEGSGTRVKVSMQYDPPAGEAGAVVAAILGASPKRQVAEDLIRFKEMVEAESDA
jgi:uncharacterized membrane protein